MAGDGHDHGCQRSVNGTGCPGCHTGCLDGAVERAVVLPELFVKRAVARLVQIEDRDDEPRPVPVAPEPTGGLDILGRSLWLALHEHQAEAENVEPDRDHVGRERDIHGLAVPLEWRFEPLLRLGNLIGRNPRCQKSGI